ncbi:YchJ family metal-binding protein [Flavobacterium sp.]|uniref:YchJ family protein n=1 Tax=Flavobacterium sp. TaxID=239 RepID=UPI00286DAD8C|nr:YchJ family metal-binding protein [Flavobacterium sp.]
MSDCYCSAENTFENCCENYLLGTEKAPTAQVLMRSRYSAYCVQNIDYLIQTTHTSTRKFYNKQDVFDFATQNKWIKLEILNFSETIVEFKAHYLDVNKKPQIHHEKSTFKNENGIWYYVDGAFFDV